MGASVPDLLKLLIEFISLAAVLKASLHCWCRSSVPRSYLNGWTCGLLLHGHLVTMACRGHRTYLTSWSFRQCNVNINMISHSIAVVILLVRSTLQFLSMVENRRLPARGRGWRHREPACHRDCFLRK